MKSARVAASCVLVFASVVCFASTSDAQVARFKAFGKKAQFTPADGSYQGGGTGTHLGRHSVSGVVAPDGEFFPEPGVFFAGSFQGVGSHTHVAANGDKLFFEIEPGRVLLLLNERGLAYGKWTAPAKITGGTGRFVGASGITTVTAINPPFDFTLAQWPFDWLMEGKIDLGKKSSK